MSGPLYDFLKKEGDITFWKNIILLVVISGIANAGLLAIINIASQNSQDEGLNYQYLAIYIVVFFIFLIAKKFSMVQSGVEIERVIKNTRDRIASKIKNSELITLEKMDSTQTLRRLARNGTTLSQSAIILISIGQSSIMIFFVLSYIFFISPLIFFTVIFSIALSIAIYIFLGKDLIVDIRKNRKIEDKFYTSLNLIINGFKELKMNAKKRDYIAQENKKNLNDLIDSKIKLLSKATTGMMFTETFLYVILGTIVFIIPQIQHEESLTIIQVTAAMLFIIGPLEATISMGPIAAKTVSSIQSLTRLENTLDEGITNTQIKDNAISDSFKNFKEISLREVEFYYTNEDKEKLFGIGPIDLSIQRGEVLFIVGGNGSGKSTLMKILLALYEAKDGKIHIDNKSLLNQHQQMYRDLFTIILTDFHLFEEIYGIENIDEILLQELLVEMKLDKKTEFKDGKFTVLNLSTGQKKRLALLISILEDKQIYVFDEWAADQDPAFRKYFYHTIIPRLKSQGKTVIAVTHDDAYFDKADRILKMDYGQISIYKGEL